MGHILGGCKGVCWWPWREAELLSGVCAEPCSWGLGGGLGQRVGSPGPPLTGNAFSCNYPVTERSVCLGFDEFGGSLQGVGYPLTPLDMGVNISHPQ